MLFDQVVAEASDLRGRLSGGVVLTNDGNNGHFCHLKKRASPSIDSDSKLEICCFKSNDNRLELPMFVNPTSAAIHRTYVARNNFDGSIDLSEEDYKADKIVDVRRVKNSQTGEMDYFVVNKGSDFLSINGTDVDPPVRAGPLPEFAVLEMRHFSIFWWRTAAALDYMPVRWSMLCLLTASTIADDSCRVSNANARTRTKNCLARPSKAIPVSPATYEACVGYCTIRKLRRYRPIAHFASVPGFEKLAP